MTTFDDAWSAKSDESRLRSGISENRPRFSNVVDAYIEAKNGKKVPVCYFKPIDALGAELSEISGGWPKVAGGVMFVEQVSRGGEVEIRWLETVDALFAWIHEHAGVRWKGLAEKNPTLCAVTNKVMHPPTKGEFCDFLTASTVLERYGAIYPLPHEPKIPGMYYQTIDLPDPTGKHLEEFLAACNPATEVDRAGLLAVLLTIGCGLFIGGTRPLFVFTSEHGIGAGKTATARAIGDVWGGIVELDADTEWPEQCKRIMSSDDRYARTFLFDNIQGRFGGRHIEAAITAKRMSGHRMYEGTVSRPNDATFIATVNGPELSPDLASRAVIINIGAPKHGVDFYGWAHEYITKHRLNIISDLLATLRAPAMHMDIAPDRFQKWGSVILGRIANGPEASRVFIARRPAVDAEGEDREAWLSMLAAMTQGEPAAEVTAADIYRRAIEAKLWKESKDKNESADRQACLRRGERLLAGTGAIARSKGDKTRKLDATGKVRSQAYIVRAVVEDDTLPPV